MGFHEKKDNGGFSIQWNKIKLSWLVSLTYWCALWITTAATRAIPGAVNITRSLLVNFCSRNVLDLSGLRVINATTWTSPTAIVAATTLLAYLAVGAACNTRSLRTLNGATCAFNTRVSLLLGLTYLTVLTILYASLACCNIITGSCDIAAICLCLVLAYLTVRAASNVRSCCRLIRTTAKWLKYCRLFAIVLLRLCLSYLTILAILYTTLA